MTDTAAAGAALEFNKFNKNARHLKRLQRETLQSIEDVGKSGNLSEDQLKEIRFSEHDLNSLNHILGVPPCIIIMGQDQYGKVAVVTRLLGEQVLPIVPILQPSRAWRPVRLKYAQQRSVSLSLGDHAAYPEGGYELLQSLQAHTQQWGTVPRADVEMDYETLEDPVVGGAVLEVGLQHILLKEGVQVVVTPTLPTDSTTPPTTPRTTQPPQTLPDTLDFVRQLLPSVLPILIYAISRDTFTEQEVTELRELRRVSPELSILFIRVPQLPDTFSDDLPESEQHDILCKLHVLPSPARPEHPQPPGHHLVQYSMQHLQQHPTAILAQRPTIQVPLHLFRTLADRLGYLSLTPVGKKYRFRLLETSNTLSVASELVESFDVFNNVIPFIRMTLQAHLIHTATLLNQGHQRCMRHFILYAFDMAREIQITPRRISYAREKEQELYESLMAIASSKQDEIRSVISQTIANMTEDLLDKAANYEFKDVSMTSSGELETSGSGSSSGEVICSREVRQYTGEIQELVISTLNAEVGKQLVDRVDVMRESYLGTLQRCLESLENDCRACGESPQIGDALKQMVNAAYQVEISVTTSSSVLRSLWEKMKQLVAVMPGRPPPVVDPEWRRKMAQECINSLSETKLTKSICSQFRERLKSSHEVFVVYMKQLEQQLGSRLEQTEEQQNRIKKVDAPKLARLSLESTSLRDMILYGMPRLDREVGRGQYGVVYGCDSWGGYRPCAVKSLVPLDEKHWNDLAMEFHYTRTVPEHERIVALRGSVIDHTYGQGETPAVLLIMDRLTRDLYSAIKHGLDWLIRLQIAQDVTQGIRFLHSQGLVHRDIKLKNVLLDKNNRAKLTDLGFCKPEAMMSGSIVGTPIHMAPELFTGHYDNSVDVYAFGILFWYICAGHVRLPLVFEQCQSKDQLWTCVKKGARPERLPQFEDSCWELMQACWAGDPSRRPLLGDVEPLLTNIMEAYITKTKQEDSETQEQETKDTKVDTVDQDSKDSKVDSAVDVVTEQCGYLGS